MYILSSQTVAGLSDQANKLYYALQLANQEKPGEADIHLTMDANFGEIFDKKNIQVFLDFVNGFNELKYVGAITSFMVTELNSNDIVFKVI